MTHKLPNLKPAMYSVCAAVDQTDDTGLDKLDWHEWLPFCATALAISKNPDDYVVFPAMVMLNDLPNRNCVGFPLKELVKWHRDAGMPAYRMWRGQPVFVEHCFTGNTLVQTSTGLLPIKKVEPGMHVLTHNLQYKPVVRRYDSGTKWVSYIQCHGLPNTIKATANHPMWVVDRRQLHDRATSSNGNKLGLKPGDLLDWSQITPHFRPVSDIYTGDYLVLPIDIGGSLQVNCDFAFLTGLYTAEGSFSKHKGERVGVVLTLGISEVELLRKAQTCLEALGLSYTVRRSEDRSTTVIVISSRDFASSMYDLVGEYSHLKRMQGELRSWDVDALKHFLGGYISGDGSVKGAARIRCVTVSKQLASDVQMAFARVGIQATVNVGTDESEFVDRREVSAGYGEVDIRRSYTIGAALACAHKLLPYCVGKKIDRWLSIKVADTGYSQLVRSFLAANYMLVPVTEVRHRVKRAKVYNLEVDGDHTYVAGGVVVHNCNEDHTKASGVVVDVALRRLQGYGTEAKPVYKLVFLMAVDKKKNPELANRILKQKVTMVSMGAYVEGYTCSKCGSDLGKCSHLNPKRSYDFYLDKDGELVYRCVRAITPFECSVVGTGAFPMSTFQQATDIGTGEHVWNDR